MGMHIEIEGESDGKWVELAHFQTTGVMQTRESHGFWSCPAEYALQCVIEPWDSDCGYMPMTREQAEHALRVLMRLYAGFDDHRSDRTRKEQRAPKDDERAEYLAACARQLVNVINWMDEHQGAPVRVQHQT